MYLGMIAGHRGWGLTQEEGWRKGPWTADEDGLLIEYVRVHGEGRWNSVARVSGLRRNGKSCRLRWVNYLRPELKRGQITPHEESIILELHAKWGNRWSTIARSLPGRTDNEIKNYWRTHFKKKSKAPCDDSEKAKTRSLRKQQFHHEQEQKQQRLQVNQAEVKRIMAFLDENNTKMPFLLPQDHTIDRQEQGCFYSMMNGNVSVPQTSSTEDTFLWDSLWNLNDVHGNFTKSAE